MIEASAPGKLVLSGEYAVLAGAPALVAAVDRRVHCALTVREGGGWRFDGGLAPVQTLAKEEVFRASPDTLPGIARRAIAEADAPPHLHIAVDSSACYFEGAKLGIGSSAALVAALAGAFRALAGTALHLSDLYSIHADFQGGGSGLDVAAAVTGGVIRFERRRVLPARLPMLHTAVVFAGSSTLTRDLVARFDAWRAGGGGPALERLCDAAIEVADCAADAGVFLEALAAYAEALERLDRVADIGILGPAHRRAQAIAERTGVVYKPCGAGGGDTGVGLAMQADAIGRFAHEAERADLTIVPMALGAPGVEVRAA